MKKFILFITLIFTGLMINAQCNYSICLEDTYGDGWDVANVTVSVNGVIIGTYTGVGYGPNCFAIPVNAGDVIFINYTGGTWPTENEWYLSDATGTLVQSSGVGGLTPGDYTLTSAVCPCGPSGVLISPIGTIICGGVPDILTFTALGSCSGNFEYQVLDGATIVQNWSTTNTYAASPLVNTTYTVVVRCSSCPSNTISDNFLVEVIDAPIITGNLHICAGDNTTLTASGSTNDFEWWTAQTGGTQLAVGPTYTTPNLFANTTYWVQANGLSSSGGKILITECGLEGFQGGTGSEDYLEISNLFSTTINSTGWVAAVSDSYSNINLVNPILWNLPSSFTACSVVWRCDDASYTGNYWGNNIFWNSSSNSWAIIIDNVGNVVDFCAWGWTAAEIASFNTVINGFNITLGPEWTGNGSLLPCPVTVGATDISLQRIGNTDSNTAADWVCQTSTVDVVNPGLFCGWVAVSCRFPVDIIVNDVEFTTSFTNPLCNGGNDGTATVNAPTGGTPVYTYLWDATAGNQITTTATGLLAGSYTVTVTDALGCTETAIITLTNPSGMTLTMSNTPDDCGSCNGTASVSVIGGTPGYTYLWSGGGGTGSTATGLCANTYAVTITDASGCTATNSTTITATGAVTANFTYNGNQCLNGNSYIFTNTGTTGGVSTFLWNFGNGVTSTQENPTYTYPAAGTYTVTFTVTQGVCVDVYTQTVTVYPHPTLAITPTDATCFGFCDGSALANPAGGSGTYNYQWDAAAGNQITQNAIALCTGSYDLTVTDTYGCSITESVTISEPVQIVLTITRTDASCNGICDGTAQVTVVGGSGSFTYLWSNLATTANITGLCAGTYDVTVTDANSTPSCFQTASVIIIEPPAITLTSSTIDATCGMSNGTATVNPSGGSPGYTYQWDANAANQITQTATGLAAGSYTVTVTDTDPCTAEITINVSDAGSPTATITSSTNLTCNGICDGDATVTIGGALNPPYDYVWSTGTNTIGTPSTLETESSLCAGNVSVVITDNNGCVATANVNITEPTAVSAVISAIIDANCGNADGSATVSAAGGIPGYTYQWDANAGNQITQTATNLAGGNYTVTVTDLSGCTTSVIATIGDIGGGTASITATTDVSCNGDCDGTATVTGVGGTIPYSYLWDALAGNQGTQTAVGLCANSYSVTITDASGCIATTSATINEPTILTSSISASSDASCNGACDGSATVNALGGTPGYTYLWPSTGTGFVENGLCTGLFTVTVTDAHSCTTVSTVTINQPTVVSGSTTVVDAHCGNTDGSATATGSGGTPGYTYQWDAATGNQNTQTASNISAGTYSVTITDSQGCTFVTTATVGDLPGGTASISSYIDVSCNGACDGSITASMGGGTIPYTYLWDDPLSQVTIIATNLCPGDYTITITDVNGCTTTAHQIITEPIILDITFSVVEISCFGVCDGEITADVTGGTLTYSYQWDDPSLSINQTITGLCDDTYCVTVTDANSCTVVACRTLTDPPLLVLSAVITEASCNQADGAIDLTITNGTVSSIIWAPGGYITEDLTNIAAGTYNVTVTDIRGCTVTGTYVVPDLTGPTATIVAFDNVDCFGNCNGTATVSGSGGQIPYTYLWSDGQNTITATNFCAGTYIASVTDANGCIATTSVIITEPIKLEITNIITSNPDCNGDCDGTAEVVVVGGTLPYTYLWTGGSPVGGNNPTDSLTTGLCAGSFTIIVTDGNACIATDNTTITEPSFISLSTSSVDATCNGYTDGSATVNAFGGTPIPGYLYQWDVATGNQTTQIANNLGFGNYCVTVTDDNGCTESICVTVNTPNPMSFVNVGSTDDDCYMAGNGSISTSVTGGSPNYTYTWTALVNATFSESTQNISNLFQDTYYLTVEDINGCFIDTFIIINQPPQLNLILYPDSENCYQACDGSINAVVSGGTPTSYTYTWSNFQNNQLADNLCPGTYSVTVTDGNGCTITDSETVFGPPELQLIIQNVIDATCGDANGSALVAQIGGTTGYTITWSNNCPNFFNNNLVAGNYTVTLTDVNGCSTDTVITINNLGGPQITSVITTDVTCYGNANGTATVNYNPSSPPAPPYTITWSSSANTSSTETGLSGGTYYVTVEDNNGCQSASSYVINEPNELITAVINYSNVNCYGDCDGSAEIQIGGGTTPYSTTWSGGQNGTIANGLCSGPATAFVTDANACPTNASITITEPNDYIITANITDALCNGDCNGIIDVSVSGATPVYTYNWLAPASGNNSVSANLCGNITYTIIISDANGCDTILDYYVGEPDPINIYTSTTSTTCGMLNGEAQIDSITGGTSPFDYNWSPGNLTTTVITNIDNGTYFLQVTDDNGCNAIIPVNVSDIPGPEALNIVSTNILCPGGNDGSASADVYGYSYPFSYAWSNGSTNQTAINLIAGQYQVIVTDSNNCTISGITIIEEPDPITVFADANPSPICIGQSSTISVNANGGTSPYTYMWSDFTDSLAYHFVYPDSTSYYFVTVTDANGCPGPVASAEVIVYPPLAVITSDDLIICKGESIGVEVWPSGGNGGPYLIQWSGGNQQNSSPNTVNPNSTTTYYVTVSDNCTMPSVIGDVLVDVIAAPNVTSITTDKGCEPLTIELKPNNFNSTWGYIWNFDDVSSGTYNTSVDSVGIHTFNNSGTYNVELTIYNAVCTTIVNGNIVVNPIPDAEFYPSPEIVGVFDGAIEFFDQSTPVISWYWSFGDNTSATDQNPEHIYTEAGIYPVHLIVTTAAGCIDTITHDIEVKEQHTFYAPTAFSPASGFQNNYFYPKGVGIDHSKYQLYIYDRWGELIFETTTYPDGTHQKSEVEGGWNGRYNYTGDYVKVGTYTWYVILTDVNEQEHEYVGSVTVIR